MTYQALRRTCATHFQKHGKSPRYPGSVASFQTGDDGRVCERDSRAGADRGRQDGSQVIGSFGTPEWIRTTDLLLRRQTLYPAELRAHVNLFNCRTNMQESSPRSRRQLRPAARNDPGRRGMPRLAEFVGVHLPGGPRISRGITPPATAPMISPTFPAPRAEIRSPAREPMPMPTITIMSRLAIRGTIFSP